jgi:cephalosporin-C deacetylase-like acetyl esterase
MKPILKYEDMVVFSFNPRSHGDSDDGPYPGQELWTRGLDSQETYYYRGAYMDCLRALDFLVKRNDVDTTNIAVWGGSQGGGFSFMLAAMDDRVDYCVADIPWLSDWVNYFKTTHWEEIDEWMYGDPRRNWNSMLTTLGYFDTMNMADKIKCPVLMGIGLQDPVCPPATSFATYNYIPGDKEYKVYLRAEHGLGENHWNYVYQWLRTNFSLKP